MAGYNGQGSEHTPTSSAGALPANPTRVEAIHRICAATLLCLLASATCPAEEEASSLEAWTRRFHRDRELVKQPAPIASAAIPAAFAVLGQTEEAFASVPN